MLRVFFADEGVFDADCLAKYAVVSIRMSRSSVTPRNSDFSRRISVAAHAGGPAAAPAGALYRRPGSDSPALWPRGVVTRAPPGGRAIGLAIRSHWYRLQLDMPRRCATSRTGYPRSMICITASALNSAADRVGLAPIRPPFA